VTTTDLRPPRPLIVACVIIALESLGLLVAAAILLIKTATGSPDSLGRALLDAAFALAGALVLGFGARGLLHLRPAARSPVLLLQLLAVPVAYVLVFQADRVAYGGPILIAALAVAYLLFTPPAREALDREPPG
jgi:hypothetical protein